MREFRLALIGLFLLLSVWTGCKPRKIEEKGTRHRSAYRFAMKNPDSLVMVISQDGPISVAKRFDDDVLVWEDVAT